jgi:hypothetical protein
VVQTIDGCCGSAVAGFKGNRMLRLARSIALWSAERNATT